MATVIVTIPGRLSSDGLQIAVPDFTHDIDGPPEVLVRPAHSAQAWDRLVALGGTVEVR